MRQKFKEFNDQLEEEMKEEVKLETVHHLSHLVGKYDRIVKILLAIIIVMIYTYVWVYFF